MAIPPYVREIRAADVNPETLPETLNRFMRSTTEALYNGLTLAENFQSQTRIVNLSIETDVAVATLLGTWENFNAATYSTAGYSKDVNGVVRLYGTIKSGGIGNPAFNIPATYRPFRTVLAPAVSAVLGSSTFVSATYPSSVCRIDADGVVTPTAGSDTVFSMDGINFLASDRSIATSASFPLTVAHSLKQVSGVIVLSAVDSADPTRALCGPAVHWSQGSGKSITIKDVSGLPTGRSYTLTLLLLAG